MILGAAERLNTFAVSGGRVMDVARNRGRAHETDRAHQRMLKERINRHLVTLNDIEDAIGQTGLFQPRCHKQRGGRVALGRLQHKGVAAGDRHGEHPHRNHRRKVKRRDARADAKRLPDRIHIDAGSHLLAVFTFQKLRNATGELHHFETAHHLALRVREHLAVLGGDGRGELVGAALGDFFEAKHHARTPQRRRGGPGRRSGRRGLHGGIDITCRGKTYLARHRAGGRVVNRCTTAGWTGSDRLAADPMTHQGLREDAFGAAHLRIPWV